MNWRELLGEGERLLSGKVPGDAASEARELLFGTLGWSLSDYALRLGEPAAEREAGEYLARAKRRAAGEPLQYITGIASFFGYAFKTDRRALIPRFDTEILVEEALRRIRPGMRILDICTGSGCVPVTLALESAARGLAPGFIYIEGSDISADALSLARENAARFGLKMRFFRSDLFEKAGRGYSIITANPPYITEEEMQALDPEVRFHEPRLALFGGRDGLDFYRRIVREAQEHLAPGGWLLMEIGSGQAAAVEELCSREGLREIRTVKDLAGRDRVVCACRSSAVY